MNDDKCKCEYEQARFGRSIAVTKICGACRAYWNAVMELAKKANKTRRGAK